jgi:Fe-S cluster biogenesis protein NfuA
VKVQTDNLEETLAGIESVWSEFSPLYPLESFFLDQQFAQLYESDQRQRRVFSSFSLIAIFIACMGLFSLAAFNAEKRRKEMGVRKVLGADFSDKNEATPSPLARHLFEYEGVENVFIYQNFISITKLEDKDWFLLKRELQQAIKKYLQQDGPIIKDDYKMEVMRAMNPQADDPEPVQKVKKVLSEEIHPATGVDGGAVMFDSYEDGVVYIRFEGAYCNCPSSKATVRSSVETILTQKVPEVKKVRMQEPFGG